MAQHFLNRELADLRERAVRSDELDAVEMNEHFVLQAMHFASCAAILRAMAEAEPNDAPSYRTVRGSA